MEERVLQLIGMYLVLLTVIEEKNYLSVFLFFFPGHDDWQLTQAGQICGRQAAA